METPLKSGGVKVRGGERLSQLDDLLHGTHLYLPHLALQLLLQRELLVLLPQHRAA